MTDPRPAVAAAVDPGSARDVARQILSEEPYLQRRSARPWAGLLERLEEWLIDPLGRLLGSVGRTLPEVGSPPWLLLAALIVVAAVAATVRLAGNRGRERFPRRAAGAADDEDSLGPEELERMADGAERRGAFAEAVRLRFRAGLLRLDDLGAIDLRPGLTNAAAARTLRSSRFDGLAHDFDEVVYGGRPATAGDADEARVEWRHLVAEAGLS